MYALTPVLLYKYLNVPKSVYDALMSASSHGSYLAAHIKGVYTYQKSANL